MGEAPTTNGHPPEPGKQEVQKADGATEPSATSASPVKKPRAPKKNRPNYGQIHRKPLPLEAHPLPAFHPTNPVSLLRLAYAYLSQILAPPTSHPSDKYIGYFSPETRSVHVTDPKHIRALWEMGFFGKGTLSRSEPSWLDREKVRLKAKRAGGGGTAEEATNARREKRRLFKLERARLEAERIERQRLVEEGKLDSSVLEAAAPGAVPDADSEPVPNGAVTEPQVPQGTNAPSATLGDLTDDEEEEEQEEIEVENQEFLQLTLEEAFFLKYGLGVLDIRTTRSSSVSVTTSETLGQFANHSYFPPRQPTHRVLPDDKFLLNYVTYHHFRSLGWVIRPGIKFSVDYLLYYRGPVFSHAEFAVMMMPSYSHPYWSSSEGRSQRRIKEDEQKDWWWLHCINRVQSAVLKSLVLVYVDVPPPSSDEDGKTDIGKLLRGYKVREFVIKRWIANRSRD